MVAGGKLFWINIPSNDIITQGSDSMAHWTYEQEVLCLTGKARLFGAAIPVWGYWLDGILIDTGHFALGKELHPLLRKQHIDRVLIQEKAWELHTRGWL